jgi:excisionase family DNA binding protein
MTPGGGDGGGMLTLQEAADRLGVHYMTAYRYVRTGRLHATRDGGRWSVAPADVDALSDLRGEASGLTGRPEGSGDGAGGEDGADRYRERLLGRLLAGDEAGSWRVVESALVARVRPDRAHLDLLAPCLREVGERWAAGTLSVGGEHVATATAARLAARLAPLRARRGRTRGTVVVAGAPGEQHVLPMTLLTNVLRARGWGVVELGADTPPADVAEAARRADRLVAVALSVGSAESFAATARTAAELRVALPGVSLLVGGPGVADAGVARRLGGEAWGADADEVDALLSAGRPARQDSVPRSTLTPERRGSPSDGPTDTATTGAAPGATPPGTS